MNQQDSKTSERKPHFDFGTPQLPKRQLSDNSTDGRLTNNILTLLISNVGSAGLSFLLSVLIGRTLGKDGLGVYAAVLAWVFPLLLVAEFGMNTLIVREVAQNPDTEDRLLRTAFRVFALIGVPLAVALMIFAPILSRDAQLIVGLRLSAPFIVISPFFGAFTAIFRARRWMWPIAALNLGMLVAQVALTTLVFLAGGDVLAALAVNTSTSAVQLAAAWWVWKKCRQRPNSAEVTKKTELSTQALRTTLRKAWPFALAAILVALQTRVSVILLEQLAGKGEVGYYAAAIRFTEAGRMIPNALFGALFPTLAALAAHPQAMQQMFRRMTLGLAVYAVLLALVFSVLSSTIVGVIYGESFLPTVPVLWLLMWSLLPALLRASQTLYWYALGREQFANTVTVITLAVQVGLSIWLIPKWGAVGVALINLLIESAAFALMWWYSRHA